MLLCALMGGLVVTGAPAAQAHFQVIQPSTDTITSETGPGLQLDILFTHPMERGPVMTMAQPVRFGVFEDGQVEDLKPALVPVTTDGKQAWRADYQVKQPGNPIFFIEPAPYWEPGEGKMIIHYAKVVVDAYGAGEGWDAMVGLPVEIRPLARPYGLWTGNVFRGVVERNGEPLPFAEIEVEWMNDGSVTPPADAFITQVIKADASGTFTYAMPHAGWWGFAALTDADTTMANPAGDQVPVELGGLIWVRAVDMR